MITMTLVSPADMTAAMTRPASVYGSASPTSVNRINSRRPARQVPGEQADGCADHDRRRVGDDRHDQRHPESVDEPDQSVPAEQVGA